MNISTLETDNAHIHLQTMILRVRNVLNECPVDPRLSLRSLRGWLDVCIRYEEEMEAQRALLGAIDGSLAGTAGGRPKAGTPLKTP
jgi:hypothetical protein